MCYVQYYTPEDGGSSVWQISKTYFAGVIYGEKSLMCQLCSLKRFPHKFTTFSQNLPRYYLNDLNENKLVNKFGKDFRKQFRQIDQKLIRLLDLGFLSMAKIEAHSSIWREILLVKFFLKSFPFLSTHWHFCYKLCYKLKKNLFLTFEPNSLQISKSYQFFFTCCSTG